MIKHVLMLFSLAVMAGCNSTPDSIQLADETNLISYPQAKGNPEQNAQRMARWGGTIASVDNQKDHTVIEVVHYPLRSYGRPKVGDESAGRFRAYVNGFVDPLVYQKGRSVTFAGKVSGSEKGQVGEHVYTFPTLDADGHHLWKLIQRAPRVQPAWGWGWGWGWGHPGFGWGNPYFHPWYGYRWGRPFPYRGGFVGAGRIYGPGMSGSQVSISRSGTGYTGRSSVRTGTKVP